MFRGSNDHLALRLRKLGLTVKQTVLLLWGLSAFLALGAGGLVRLTEKGAFVFLLILAVLGLVCTLIIASVPMEEKNAEAALPVEPFGDDLRKGKNPLPGKTSRKRPRKP
jgi:hypothetical protein